MFDFGFWEIAIIGVITLVVVGPDKMPALARKAGSYAGKATKFINKVKKEINDELKADELKDIKNQLIITNEDSVLSQVFKETKQDLDAIKKEGAGIK
ncbi:MAG TPA: twin-arginine translocase subunit TatB, partial [Candidatus Thioglobus sp.]|nr:twin-arginine translocase subunit TatB [Candidatus Thioglobus sp.]